MNEQYYYCLVHSQVEPADSGCRNEDRLGPYATRAEAERALDKVAKRNESWDNDPRWNDELED